MTDPGSPAAHAGKCELCAELERKIDDVEKAIIEHFHATEGERTLLEDAYTAGMNEPGAVAFWAVLEEAREAGE